MKKKIITALLVLTLILGLTGCDFSPKPELFVGKWVNEQSILNINEDYTYTWDIVISGLLLNSEKGTWVLTGRDTITLFSDNGFEYSVERFYDDWEEKYYLLIDESTKLYTSGY